LISPNHISQLEGISIDKSEPKHQWNNNTLGVGSMVHKSLAKNITDRKWLRLDDTDNIKKSLTQILLLFKKKNRFGDTLERFYDR
jgi:hypothetical protein